jgi:hypothetical protein
MSSNSIFSPRVTAPSRPRQSSGHATDMPTLSAEVGKQRAAASERVNEPKIIREPGGRIDGLSSLIQRIKEGERLTVTDIIIDDPIVDAAAAETVAAFVRQIGFAPRNGNPLCLVFPELPPRGEARNILIDAFLYVADPRATRCSLRFRNGDKPVTLNHTIAQKFAESFLNKAKQ